MQCGCALCLASFYLVIDNFDIPGSGYLLTCAVHATDKHALECKNGGFKVKNHAKTAFIKEFNYLCFCNESWKRHKYFGFEVYGRHLLPYIPSYFHHYGHYYPRGGVILIYRFGTVSRYIAGQGCRRSVPVQLILKKTTGGPPDCFRPKRCAVTL